MTRHEAHIEKDWREHGLAQVVVARLRDDGSAEAGVFLVDTFCLGVKDAFFEAGLSAAELENLVAQSLPEERRERLHPACAKKLIEGAVAYAATLGFEPHRDFRKARRALSGIDAALCPTEFAFGCEGRPCYVQGPHDSAERVDRVLAMLEARCGADGFDYELVEGDGEDGDMQDVRLDLMDWLDAAPPEVPRFYQLAGIVAALHTCPNAVPPGRLLGALSASGLDWPDQETARQFAERMERYWNYVGEFMHDATAPDAPPATPALDIWEEDFSEDDEFGVAAASMEWAIGFLRTTELWPEAWGNAVARPDLAPHWEVIRWWANLTDKGDWERIKAAGDETPPRSPARAVVALARALRPAAE